MARLRRNQHPAHNSLGHSIVSRCIADHPDGLTAAIGSGLERHTVRAVDMGANGEAWARCGDGKQRRLSPVEWLVLVERATALQLVGEDPVHYHGRLFQLGGMTVGNVVLESNDDGTATHEVLHGTVTLAGVLHHATFIRVEMRRGMQVAVCDPEGHYDDLLAGLAAAGVFSTVRLPDFHGRWLVHITPGS